MPVPTGYKLFGLRILSEIDLGWRIPVDEGDAAGDIVIECGPVPSELAFPAERGLRFESAPERFLFHVHGVGRFLITGGTNIRVEVAQGAEIAALRLFLLGPAITAALRQREDFVLSGSAVSWGTHTVAFIGGGCSGKSTLAAAFARRGGQLLTDELLVLRPDGKGRRYIQLGSAAASLWIDSVRRFDLQPAELNPIRQGIKKFIVPLPFAVDARPLDICYILETHGDNPSVSSIGTEEAYSAIAEELLPAPGLRGLGLRAINVQMLSAFAMHCPLRKIVRPRHGYHVETIADLVAEELN